MLSSQQPPQLQRKHIKKKFQEKIDNYKGWLKINAVSNILTEIKSTPSLKKDIKTTQLNSILTYQDLYTTKYTIKELQKIAKEIKIKVSGNKEKIIENISSHLYLSTFATKIQKLYRGWLVRYFVSLHGPAVKNKKLCNNTTDFISMEPVDEIPFPYFISIQDIDRHIYGFDLNSLVYHVKYFSKTNNKLINKKLKNIDINPYNRTYLDLTQLINIIKKIKNIGQLIGIPILLQKEDSHTYEINTEPCILPNLHIVSSPELINTIHTYARDVFYHIDSLGHYTNANWFIQLNAFDIYRMIFYLKDIWNYRAEISSTIRHNICPEGDPLRFVHLINTTMSLISLQQYALDVFMKLISTGINQEYCELGCFFVLGSLTLVSEEAALALPWLYQSFFIPTTIL